MTEHEGSLPADFWERVSKKVELYAARITGRPNSLDQNAPIEYMIGDAVSPTDLASQVLSEFLTGKIKPDPEKELTERYLVNLLKGAVKKRFYDLLRKIEARETDYAQDVSEHSEKGHGSDFFDTYKVKKISGYDRHQILSDAIPAPDEGDQILKYQESLNALYEQVKGDEPLREVIRAICEEELEAPREIAAYLKTSRKDIYNRLKKLRRRFKYLVPVKHRQKKAV